MVVADVCGGGHPLVQGAVLRVVGRVVELDGVLGARLEATGDVGVVEVVLAARGGLRGADELPRLVVQVDRGRRHRALARQLEAGALGVVPDPVADLERGLVAEHFKVAHRGALAERRHHSRRVEPQAELRVLLAVPLEERGAVTEGGVVGVEGGGRDGVLDLGEGHAGEGRVAVAAPGGVEEAGAPGRQSAAVVGVHHVTAVDRAGLVEVTARHHGGDGARRRAGRGAVAEAVPEGQQHRAVGLEGDLAQLRFGVGDGGGTAGVAVLRGRIGVGPREPARPVAGAAADGALARVVQRLSEHRPREGTGAEVERQHDRAQVGDLAGGLARADAAEVAGAVLEAEAERPPVHGRRAAGVGDRVTGLRRGGRGPGGVVAVELAVVEVDDEEVLAVVGDLDAAEALLARHRQEPVVGAAAVGGRAGVRDGGEELRGLRGQVGHVDRARAAGAVVRGALGDGGGEQPAVRPVPGDAEQGAGVGVGGEVGGVDVHALLAARAVREGQQRALRPALARGRLAGRDQRGVLLAVVAGAPQSGGVGDVLAAGEVDELLVAAQLVGRTGQALPGGKGRVELAGLRIHHLDAVLAAGRLGRGRRQRHRAVGRRGALDARTGVVGEGHPHPGQSGFKRGRPHPGGVHGPHHADGHGAVARLREGLRRGHQRDRADADGQRRRSADGPAAGHPRPSSFRAANGARLLCTCRCHPCSHGGVGPAAPTSDESRSWRKAAVGKGSLKGAYGSSQENQEL